MLKTIRVADADVFSKMDTEHLRAISEGKFELENTALIYVCKSGNLEGWKNRTWEKQGITYHIIVLPHSKIRDMNKDDVQKLMLNEAVERAKKSKAN
jgi:hypothetical protein